jgi:hypothetical protein
MNHYPAHPNSEPGVLRPTTSLDVRFISMPPLEIQIKNVPAMKPSATPQNEMMVPSLFQLAAHFEDIVAAGGLRRSATRLSQTPFASLMLHPEKLMSLLKFSKAGNDPAAEPVTNGSNPVKPAKTAPSPRATSKKRGDSRVVKPAGQSPYVLKKIEFCLAAPSAGSVKLAADFTDWEKCPVEMMHSGDGNWLTVVPLAPGPYSYRFIVDGQWRSDPRAARRVPNPFGTENSMIVVI